MVLAAANLGSVELRTGVELATVELVVLATADVILLAAAFAKAAVMVPEPGAGAESKGLVVEVLDMVDTGGLVLTLVIA